MEPWGGFFLVLKLQDEILWKTVATVGLIGDFKYKNS